MRRKQDALTRSPAPGGPEDAPTTAVGGSTRAAAGDGSPGSRSIPRHQRPASFEHSGASGVAWSIWERCRWTVSTLGVAGGAFLVGFFSLWAASWITHSSVGATALRWDGSWYYRISQVGYTSSLPTGPTDSAALRPAFFPGLPLLEHVVHDIVGGGPARTTLLVGVVGLAACCLLLRSLVALQFDEEVAWRATVIFAFFPGGYVFFFGYSEALEIPLAILVLYALRRRWYLVAGVATALATGTRLTGVALVVACAIAAGRELVLASRTRRVRWGPVVAACASPIIGLGGLVGFMAYLHAKTGSFTAFRTAERVGWYNTVSFTEPYHALVSFFQHPLQVPVDTVNAAGVVVVVACLVAVVVAAFGRLRVEESAYAAVILLAWLFTTNTGAWFRFVQCAFPVLILCAVWSNRRSYAVAACVGAGLLAMLIVLFGAAVSFSP